MPYAIATSSKGLAKSPWPMRGQNAQHTGRASAIKTSSATPNSPEAAAAIEAAIRKAAGKPTGELTQADLEKVTRLDLQANHLTEAPKGLEKLTNLESLVLYNNQLTNAAGLEKLTQLKGLELGNNQLTDVADLGKLTQLRELNLASNNHPIKVPKGLENLTQLTSLHLSANQLTEPPESLEKLTGLKYLYLQQNQLTEIPKSLEKLTQLGYLNLKDNPALTKEQIAQLQKALPECKIEHNAGPTIGTEIGSIASYDPKFGFYVVDRGADHGIKNGDEFSVFRAGKFVGKIRIKQVQPTVSIAEAIKDLTPQKLQAGDKVGKMN